MRRSAVRDEAGTATVLVMPLLGVIVLVTIVSTVLGSLAVAQRRVQAAADLAALAGASALPGAAGACVAAVRLSRRNGADLVSCRLAGRDVRVEVAVQVTGLIGPSVTVRAQARAGPAAGGTGVLVPHP